MPKKVGYPNQRWGQSGRPERAAVEQQNREVRVRKTGAVPGNQNMRKLVREIERAERRDRF